MSESSNADELFSISSEETLQSEDMEMRRAYGEPCSGGLPATRLEMDLRTRLMGFENP